MKCFELPVTKNRLMTIAAILFTWISCAQANFVFGPPKNLGPRINGPHHDLTACLSSDGLSLYFSSDRPVPENPSFF